MGGLPTAEIWQLPQCYFSYFKTTKFNWFHLGIDKINYKQKSVIFQLLIFMKEGHGVAKPFWANVIAELVTVSRSSLSRLRRGTMQAASGC
jgi:hypothetical protein